MDSPISSAKQYIDSFKGENGPMPISFSLSFSLKGLSILKIGMEMCISVKWKYKFVDELSQWNGVF